LPEMASQVKFIYTAWLHRMSVPVEAKALRLA